MAARSFEEVLRDINNKIYAPVYLLTGDEPYFIDQISDLIEKTVLDESEKDFNQTILYGRDCDALQLISIAKRFPMMSNYQVVIVREAQEMKALTSKSKEDEDGNQKDDNNPLAEYFTNPLKSTVLVLCMKYKAPDKRTKLYKAIDKHGIVFTGKKLYDNQIGGWVQKYLESKGRKIDGKAAQLMTEHIGNDLSRIANECDKLLFTVKEGTTISTDDVALNIGISKEFNIFELQAALGNRDVLKVNKIVNYFIANPKANPMVMTVASLNGYFTKILLTHAAPDKSEAGLASVLKVSPYFVKDYKSAARNYSFDKAADVIGLLREYDLRSKGVGNTAPEGDLLREMTYRILH